MNITELQSKLIAVARANPPGDHVPYSFEKRVLARLAGSRATDLWGAWAPGLCRAAVSCVGITILFTAWTLLAGNRAPANDLSQDFDNTVLAAAAQDTSQMIW